MLGRRRRAEPATAAASAGEPATLDEVVPLAQLVDELRDLEEIVAVVGVAHKDELAARGGDPAHERVAVALLGDGHDARPEVFGELLRTVRGAVVRDDDLTTNAVRPQRA
jgi:hypothetical protein